MAEISETFQPWHFYGRPAGLVAIIIYKAAAGLIEITTGALFFFSFKIIAEELAEDPQDVFLNWLLSQPYLNFKGAMHLGIFIAILGLLKLALAVSLWYRSWLMRRILIVFFSVAILFGGYYVAINFSVFKAVTLLAEASILFYLWKILPKHLGDKGVV